MDCLEWFTQLDQVLSSRTLWSGLASEAPKARLEPEQEELTLGPELKQEEPELVLEAKLLQQESKSLLVDSQLLALELERLQAGPVLEEQEPMVELVPQQGLQLE